MADRRHTPDLPDRTATFTVPPEEACRRDPRLEGLMLVAPRHRGAWTRLSDLDVVLVCSTQGARDEVVDELPGLAASLGPTLLAAFVGGHTTTDCLESVAAAVELYVDLRVAAGEGVERRTAAEEAARGFLHAQQLRP
jgi:predicted nucleotidyltransferase